MGRLLTLTRTDTIKMGVRKEAFKPSIRVGRKSLGFITIILFLVLSLFYLAQANEIATKGYKIRELEDRKATALETQERLQIEASRLRSIKAIEENATSKNMQPAAEINYITKDSSVAKK